MISHSKLPGALVARAFFYGGNSPLLQMFFQFSEHAVKGAFFEHPCAILSAASFEFLGYDVERAKGQGGGAEHIFLCYYVPSIRGQRGIEDVINGVIGEIKLR